MPYITSIERIGIQQGIQQGILSASINSIIQVLEIRFNTVPEHIAEMIKKINDPAVLKELHRSAIKAESLIEFEKNIDPIWH